MNEAVIFGLDFPASCHGGWFSSQFLVGEALADNRTGNMVEAVRVFPAPFIEPEGLLTQIPMKVERLYTDV